MEIKNPLVPVRKILFRDRRIFCKSVPVQERKLQKLFSVPKL